MKTLQFKTNIKCSGCVAQVTPVLNQIEGVEKWEVDINHPDKILKVDTQEGDSTSIIQNLSKIGFKAEIVS